MRHPRSYALLNSKTLTLDVITIAVDDFGKPFIVRKEEIIPAKYCKTYSNPVLQFIRKASEFYKSICNDGGIDTVENKTYDELFSIYQNRMNL
jgi:hypothetical protein